MQTKREVAANPQTKPINLDCVSAANSSYHPQPPSPCIITQPDNWYPLYCPTESGRQSWPRDCSKGCV